MHQVQLDGGAAVRALSSIFVALVFGLVPALQVSRRAARYDERFSGTTVRSHTMLGALVVVKWRWR